MSGITFSGLASGLDTGALVDKLVALERGSAVALTTKQTNLNAQKSVVAGLSSALSALGSAARAMDLDSEVKPRGVTVSDTHVSVAVSSSASAVDHEFRVKSLAASQVTQSKSFAPNTPGVLGTGGVDITVGGTTKSIAWDATDTLTSVADKINAANAGVSASVLNVDGSNYRLVVTAKETGTAKAPTFSDSGSGLDLSLAANVKVPASNAVVDIDGIEVTRSSNLIADALAGVTITLGSKHAATDPNTKASIALDNKALTERVKALVTAYNAVHGGLRQQLAYTGTTKGPGTLFGDAGLRQLQGALDVTMSSAYGSSSLGALGLSRDKTGALSLDETKLSAAVATDPDAVSGIFVTGGFANTMGSLAERYTKASTGLFAAKTSSLTSRHTSLQSQIDRINRGADALQVRLEKQFGALEQAMSQLQSQSSSLAALFK
ncbi:MAG: flagellar filament capping protein FliD [Kofleriaceae bacterium]